MQRTCLNEAPGFIILLSYNPLKPYIIAMHLAKEGNIEILPETSLVNRKPMLTVINIR